MKIEYEVIQNTQFNVFHQSVFADLLSKQGRVQGNLMLKVNRCKFICLAKMDGRVVAIGAIKKKTKSDFSNDKADVPDLADDFEWELGYLYTEPDYGERGIASMIVRLLIEAYGGGNLMASTEITANPRMVRILEKHGFRFIGKPWKSKIHGKYLGLFLKFE